jgi:pilus assembly protein CpaC
MGNWTLSRATLLVALTPAFGFAASSSALAADQSSPPGIQLSSSDATSRFISLGIGKSMILDLPSDAKEVLIADPTIANIVLRTSRRAYLIGAKVGQTNVYFFDAEGGQISGLDIAVTRDLNGISAALRRALPSANIHVEGIGEDGVMLTGTVANAAESQLAYDLAKRLVSARKGITGTTIGSSTTAASGSGASNTTSSTTSTGPESDGGVVNGLIILGRDQVMLKVTVAEVQRDVVKQLGINLNGSVGFGSTVINFNTTDQVVNGPLSASNIAGIAGKFKSVNATLRAMEQAGVVRTLAEPTLTAISGQSASFLAGGEFPYVTVNESSTGFPTTTTSFKPFGVSLNFTPVVMSEGRISMRVMTEVSELSADGAVGGVPALKSRKVESTLEIPSGGSLAMAGMIQESTKQNINGFPGLMQVPILGTLFKSRDYINKQTELMVIVTPYIVRAVARKDLSRPDDGFADASDPASVLLGRFNRIYGVARAPEPKRPYHGNYGFILD